MLVIALILRFGLGAENAGLVRDLHDGAGQRRLLPRRPCCRRGCSMWPGRCPRPTCSRACGRSCSPASSMRSLFFGALAIERRLSRHRRRDLFLRLSQRAAARCVAADRRMPLAGQTFLPLTPASAKVAMPVWQATAALQNCDRQRRARSLAQAACRGRAAAACRCAPAACRGRARPRHGRRRSDRAHVRRARAAPPPRPSRRSRRAAPACAPCARRCTAPQIAASSWPPRRARISRGSRARSRWRATPAATTSFFRCSAVPATPVPGPTQSSAVPPNSARQSAAALVVLAMPISPRQSRSRPGSTAIMP